MKRAGREVWVSHTCGELKYRSYCLWMMWWKMSRLLRDLPTCLVLPVHNFSSLCRQKKKKIKTKHSSSVSPLNKNSLLQQKMYGCCCWCGRWDFPHHSKPWLKYVNSVSLIAVKHQREAWKISVIFDPLPILQQMALQQHSVAWAAGPIRAAKTA